MATSRDLEALWLAGRPGSLCPWQQARALALREVSQELHKGRSQLSWIAARVEKVGGGRPTKVAILQLFQRVDADPEWFPGKQRVGKRGCPPLLTPAKRRCIAHSAMSAKRTRGDEPCVEAVIHTCPRATTNPKTRRPFCKKTIRKVFTQDCHDFTAQHPCRFQNPLQKVFLPVAVKEHRSTHEPPGPNPEP